MKYKSLVTTLFDRDDHWDSKEGWLFAAPVKNRRDALKLSTVLTTYDLD